MVSRPSQSLKGIDLHDSRLLEVRIQPASGIVIIELEIYENESAKNRVPASITCRGVAAFTGVLDFVELADNHSPGNVMTCRSDSKRGILRLYVADGYAEIKAAEMELRVS